MDLSQEILNNLALDLFNPEKRNTAQPKLREFMSPLHTPEFAQETTDKLLKIFNYLTQLDPSLKVGVMGYCFGGTYSYSMAVREPRLAFAIPYYGHCEYNVQELVNIKCPILAFYGQQDAGLVSGLAELKERMEQAHVNYQYQIYNDCGHAFFNDTNRFAYNKAAAVDAWDKTLEFLKSAS